MSCERPSIVEETLPPKNSDPLDVSTFVFPEQTPTITIEFCDRVRADLVPIASFTDIGSRFSAAGKPSLTISLENILTPMARLHRATWVQTELFLTFPPPVLGCITLIPRNSDDTAGRFRVWLSVGSEPPLLLWDRKVEGGFPELKVLVSR